MRTRTVRVALVAVMVVVVGIAVTQAVRANSDNTWHTVFSDDFTGSSLDTAKWNTCYYWADHGCTITTNNEMEWYLPSGVSVSDGHLRLTARADPVRGSDDVTYPYRSGMVSTGPARPGGNAKFAFTYGRVEAGSGCPRAPGSGPRCGCFR